jgi:ADP-heptose:LPS heptosyltransferase
MSNLQGLSLLFVKLGAIGDVIMAMTALRRILD